MLVAPLALLAVGRPAWAHGDVVTSLRFERDIRPIFLRACVGCHSPGGAAPMPLQTYEEARPWATAIKEELLEHRMPPWPAVAGFGAFRNAPALTQRDIDRIVDWVEGGGPRGVAFPDPQAEPAHHATARPRASAVEADVKSLSIPMRRVHGDTLAGAAFLKAGAWIVGLRPPAHDASASVEVVARPPAGSPRILLRTLPERGPGPDVFHLKRPVFVPSGTRIAATVSSHSAAADFAVLLIKSKQSQAAPSWDPGATANDPWAGASRAVGFTCPMHPQVVSDVSGSCPLCGMELIPAPALAQDFDLELETGALEAGRKAAIVFRIRHPVSGRVVQDFALLHERPMHVFIVSEDLAHFEHVHPEPQRDGTFRLETLLPDSGLYRVYVEAHPAFGSPQLLQDHLATRDYDPEARHPSIPLRADDVLRRREGRTEVALRTEPAEAIAGKPLTLSYTLKDAETGRPLTDLAPYLGALAHTVMVSEDLEACIHAHPREATLAAATTASGTRLTSRVLPPREGAYRIWTQFVRGDELVTTAFTIRAAKLR